MKIEEHAQHKSTLIDITEVIHIRSDVNGQYVEQLIGLHFITPAILRLICGSAFQA